MDKWFDKTSNNLDVVMYSKVSISRNLQDFVFPNRMSNDVKKTVSKKILATIKNSSLATEFDLINISDLTRAKALSYADKGIISKDFAQNTNSNFMLSQNKDVSIVINDDDHICINSFASGQNLDKAYNFANDIDDIFLKGLKIAYKDNLGFLTSSPVLLGTGLKVSFVLHLPALVENGLINKLSSMVSRLGLSLNELYPDMIGDMFVLTNQVTLGVTEKSAMDNLNAVCQQIVKQERNARESLKDNPNFEDKIYRTLGVLKLARKLSLNEFLESISLVRLGISLGYFEYDYELIHNFLYNLFDASLVDSSKSDLSKEMCEKLRAQIIREKL